jgi:hypothetical protein
VLLPGHTEGRRAVNFNYPLPEAKFKEARAQQSLCCFSAEILLHIVCIFNILMQTEVTFQDSLRIHFVIYVFMCNI